MTTVRIVRARTSGPRVPRMGVTTNGLLETAVRLLGTAGTAVSAVGIEAASDDAPELRSDTVTARVRPATATGTQPGQVAKQFRGRDHKRSPVFDGCARVTATAQSSP